MIDASNTSTMNGLYAIEKVNYIFDDALLEYTAVIIKSLEYPHKTNCGTNIDKFNRIIPDEECISNCIKNYQLSKFNCILVNRVGLKTSYIENNGQIKYLYNHHKTNETLCEMRGKI